MEQTEKTKELMRRIADLLIAEQGRLGLTNFQMAQRLDISRRTYDNLKTGKAHFCYLATLDRIFENLNITYDDVFEGIYKSKYSKKEI